MNIQKSFIKVVNHDHIKEDKYKPDEWRKMLEDLRRCIVKVPEWVYYHFLESVPPIYPSNKIGFFNSEPLTHDKNGNPIYYYFFKYENSFYGCITTKQTQEFCYKLAKESLNKDK